MAAHVFNCGRAGGGVVQRKQNLYSDLVHEFGETDGRTARGHPTAARRLFAPSGTTPHRTRTAPVSSLAYTGRTDGRDEPIVSNMPHAARIEAEKA